MLTWWFIFKQGILEDTSIKIQRKLDILLKVLDKIFDNKSFEKYFWLILFVIVL